VLQQRGTIMDFSRLYEVSSAVDEHSDMRLDIDSMTYEVCNAHSTSGFHISQYVLSDLFFYFHYRSF
jgi:hypothetical protein